MQKILTLALVLFSIKAAAIQADLPLGEWLKSEKSFATERMLKNISPADAVPGVVVASPSKDNPNYYFHWIRDASLTMDQVVFLYANSREAKRATYQGMIEDFVALTLRQQKNPGKEGLGEPRYLIDGSADTLPWGRPQYDGPALRALTLIHFINFFPKTGLSHKDKQLKADTISAIQTDLDYVTQKWNTPCFDLWEELRGLHFYTQSVQYSAMMNGAVFFRAQGDPGFARLLQQTALQVKSELEKYWDEKKGYLGASRNLEQAPGSTYKSANLDTAVVLSALHSSDPYGKIGLSFLALDDDRLMATVAALEAAFLAEYKINASAKVPAIGRFTDDVYFYGNPWYMTTAGFAELYFRLTLALINSRSLKVTAINSGFLNSVLLASLNSGPLPALTVGTEIAVQSDLGQRILSGLTQKGDGYLSTLQKYVGSQGEMSEQFDREAGVPVSAPDLTWSYASFLSAARARAQLNGTP